jgi:hypothetical protein
MPNTLKNWSQTNKALLAYVAYDATKPDRTKPLSTALQIDMQEDPTRPGNFVINNAHVVEREMLANGVPALREAMKPFDEAMLVFLNTGVIAEMVPIALQDDLETYKSTGGDWKENMKSLMMMSGIETTIQ